MKDKKDIFDRIMSLPGLRIFKAIYKKHKEMLLYIFFGGLTTLVSIGTYSFFCIAFCLNEHLANVFSWIIAVAFAYVTNRIWVFKSQEYEFYGIVREIINFFGGRVLTLIVEEVILFVFITVLHFNSIGVKAIAQVVIIVLNYLISKVFVFNNKSISK